MPLYEYKCVKCGHRFEKIESVSASETKKCPKCGARAERMASAPAIQFKGSGWYVTDYAGKNKATPSGESGDGAAKSDDKTSEKSGDSKKETKAESKQAAPENSNKGAANRKKK